MEIENDKATGNAQTNMDDFDDDGEIGPIEDRKKKIKEEVFTACKKGDAETVAKKINSKLLNVLEGDENKWTPLQWAVVNNHPEVVKIVYKKQKEVEDSIAKAEQEKKQEDKSKVRQLSDLDEAFKKPLDPAKNGKYTPLHWSAYKGFDLISSILLNMGCDPLQVDGYGNNALHHAAASNNVNTFKLFMGLGIDLEYKNSRSHMAIDLTTNKDIQKLIKTALETRKCKLCEKVFDFFNKRYVCCIKDEIICKNCSVIDLYYAEENSKEKEIRYCRCKQCQDEILEKESQLREAIQSNNLDRLNEQIANSAAFQICKHLRRDAYHNQNRLQREKQINELLDSLATVPDHKTIKKSVDTLVKLVQNAEDNKVKLDSTVIQRAFLQKNRLEAERDLRQVLDNVTVAQSTKENLDNLSEKVDNAKKCSVDDCYVSVGADLVEKISQNLKATEILQMFLEYPIREYPVVEEVDPKKKSKLLLLLLLLIQL